MASKAIRRSAPAHSFLWMVANRDSINSTAIVDPEFDTDAYEDELTGVGLDHLHQGNGLEHQQAA